MVEDRNSIQKNRVRSHHVPSPFFQSKYRRKFPVITENFGTWGRKFPAHIKQPFSPTQQDESCVIRAGWRNSADRLVTVYRIRTAVPPSPALTAWYMGGNIQRLKFCYMVWDNFLCALSASKTNDLPNFVVFHGKANRFSNRRGGNWFWVEKSWTTIG